MKLIAMLVGGLIVGVVGASDSAKAEWKRQHASVCYPASSAEYAVYSTTNGLQNSTTGDITLICPFNEDSLIRRVLVTTLNAHGNHGGGGRTLSASACAKVWNASGAAGTGFNCGSVTASTTTTGVFALSPGLSAWSLNEGDFGYVKVVLPSASSLYGIYAAY